MQAKIVVITSIFSFLEKKIEEEMSLIKEKDRPQIFFFDEGDNLNNLSELIENNDIKGVLFSECVSKSYTEKIIYLFKDKVKLYKKPFYPSFVIILQIGENTPPEEIIHFNTKQYNLAIRFLNKSILDLTYY